MKISTTTGGMKILTTGGKEPDEAEVRYKADIEAGLLTYYCDLCKLELNSEDTMKAHVAGLKHMKKTLAAAQQQNISEQVPILPRIVADINVDLKDQNLDEKSKARIEDIISQAKLVSKSSLAPQPTKLVMKKKAKKTSACHAFCDLFGCMIVTVLLVLLGVSFARIYDYYTANSQMERHNNLVRYVDCLRKNQDFLYNGINDVITKVSNLTERHNSTRDELSLVEYTIIDLFKDLQTLKDSVKHLEEEIHHSDEEEEQVVDYHGTPMPTTTPIGRADTVFDGEDLHDHEEDSDYPFSDSSMSYPEISSPTPPVTPATSLN